MNPQALAEALAGVAAELGTVALSASTDTHTVVVSEPCIWDPPRPIVAPLYGFDVEIREHDL